MFFVRWPAPGLQRHRTIGSGLTKSSMIRKECACNLVR
jgi:hypothetical protein